MPANTSVGAIDTSAGFVMHLESVKQQVSSRLSNYQLSNKDLFTILLLFPSLHISELRTLIGKST